MKRLLSIIVCACLILAMSTASFAEDFDFDSEHRIEDEYGVVDVKAPVVSEADNSTVDESESIADEEEPNRDTEPNAAENLDTIQNEPNVPVDDLDIEPDEREAEDTASDEIDIGLIDLNYAENEDNTENADSESDTAVYEVMFIYVLDTESQSEVIETQYIEEHEKPTYVEAPDIGGYRFEGWYLDADGFCEYAFDEEVTEDLTVYALYTQLFGTLTIENIGGSPNEYYLYHVFGAGVDTMLTVRGGESGTVMEIAYGEITVEEMTDWSWRFDTSEQSYTVCVSDAEVYLGISYEQAAYRWLSSTSIG